MVFVVVIMPLLSRLRAPTMSAPVATLTVSALTVFLTRDARASSPAEAPWWNEGEMAARRFSLPPALNL